ncbi:DUF3987 domain-containing protein [Cereibacter azotoformans]|nr:DUF3987 domain-containing protein [Cereibacter azotoformans]
MFDPRFTPEELAKAGTAPKADGRRPVVPVPADAPPMDFRHTKLDKPSSVWRYTTADGGLVGYVARFDFKGKDGEPDKTYLPITFCEAPGKRPAWMAKAFPEPRPLYRLHEFTQRPEAALLIGEGEKVADAAAGLLPEVIGTTPPGGAKAPSKADWAYVKGRRVIIATDADKPGREFGDEVARLAREAGAAEILHLPGEELRSDAPEGYDLADAVEEGISADQVRRAIRAYEFPASSDQTAAEHGWGEPDPRYLQPQLLEAPVLPLNEVFAPAWVSWIGSAAEAKGAPADYVVAGLLSVAGAMIGNSRWACPWDGWTEPPLIWTMAIGNPSAGKSPGLDAILAPLRIVERNARQEAQTRVSEWRARAEVAKLAESTWKEAVKAAIKAGDDIPPKPREADPGPEPMMPRYALADTTVEKLSVILAGQPRGTMMFRDELSGWLGNMSRYSGGTDRPFWLEAYGGKGYSVERMGRDPVWISRLTVGVVGGIQPDKLKSLLMKTDDDGLLARFIPVWPEPAPIKRPNRLADEGFIENALRRLVELPMVNDEHGELRPWFINFNDEARDYLNEFRKLCRDMEGQNEGLLLSFIGKLPGMAVRLSLILAFLDWAAGGPDVFEITPNHFGRAAGFIEAYVLPMAVRAYADGAVAKEDRAGRKLAALIIEQGWEDFNSSDVLRLDRAGLATKADLDPALDALVVGDLIRQVPVPGGPRGGRPARRFIVNPAIRAAT